MQLTETLFVRRLSETVAGELIRVRFGGHIGLCLVLDNPQPPQQVPVAILTIVDPPKQLPLRITVPHSDYCVSLGTDWLFEPIAGEGTYVGSAEQKFAPGTVNVEHDGRWILNIRDWDSFTDSGFHFDLASSQLTEGPSNYAAPLQGWRIWQGQYDPEHGQPLFAWPREEGCPLSGSYSQAE